MDIGIKRDTAAVTAVYRHYETNLLCLWGSRVFEPPVNLVTQVEPLLFWLFDHCQIGALAFDEYQFAASEARLEADGHGNKLMPVNQQTVMREATNALHQHCIEGQFLAYKDPVLRSHFSWCSVKYTERGPHIIKSNQSRQIDGVVSLAMALWAATNELGYTSHPGYSGARQGRSALKFP